MKKQLLFLLLFISTIAFSQTTTTPVGSIKHNNALILNNVADTLLVRNPTTKRIEGISKLVLIDQVKATIVYPATNISIGNRTANTIGVYSSTGTGAILPAVSTTEAGLMPATDKVKLNGIATGATANSTDAQLRDRTTHTGVQAIATVTGLQTALDGKQNNLGFTPYNATNPSGFTANSTDAQLRDRTLHTGVQAIATVTGLQSALDSKQATGDYATNTTVTNGLNTKINNSEKAVANGVATLGSDGKVPNNQIPALAISETFPVSSEAQMIGLSQAEQGDVAIRSDLSKAFILRQSPSSVLANWSELLTPASTVTSVAGKVGAVVLNNGDVGLGNVPNTDFTSAVNLNTAKITNSTHTGDVTGSTALTLATVNSNVGSFNNVTVNGKGLVTGASNVTYATGGGTATGINTGDQDLSGKANISGANFTGPISTTNNLTVGGDVKGDGNPTLKTFWGGAYSGGVQIKTDGGTVDRYARIGMISGTKTWQGGMTINNDVTASFTSSVSAPNFIGSFTGNLTGFANSETFSSVTSRNPDTGSTLNLSSTTPIRFGAAASGDLFLGVIPNTRILEIRNGNSASPNYGACGLITGFGDFRAPVRITAGSPVLNGQVNSNSSLNLGLVAGNYGYGISTNNNGGLDVMSNQGGQPIRFWSGTANENPTKSAEFNGLNTYIFGKAFINKYVSLANYPDDFATNIPWYGMAYTGGTTNTHYSGYYGIQFNTAGGLVNINSGGSITTNGTITASGGFFNSDIRLKNIIKRDGDVIYFTWKDKKDTKTHIGYIAQKVRATNPDQVNKDDKGYLSVNYIEILVEKIRNLEKEIELLKAK
jgi:hypothetical protein